MRPYYLLALLPLLFSASCVYTLPIDDVSLSASTDLDFANAEETDDYSLGFDDVAEDNADEDLRGGRRIRQAVKRVLRSPKPAPAPAKAVAKKSPAPPPVAPTVLPVSVATHKIIPVPQTQSEKAKV